MRVKIYVEGGGDASALKRECRRGFSEFFRKAGLEGRMPQVVACGSRDNAFDDFRTAVRRAAGDQFTLLLVDSEEGVAMSDSPWDHVSKRDRWTRPARAGAESLCLMVQCMEAWFVADKDSLKAYYGQGFDLRRLPRRPEVEKIPKADLYAALDRATRNCTKGKYRRAKGRHSFSILATVDPSKVAAASPHASRLLQTLREAVA